MLKDQDSDNTGHLGNLDPSGDILGGGGIIPDTQVDDMENGFLNEGPNYSDIHTGWVNTPGISDLQADIDLTLSNRNWHASRIREWRDMYHCRGVYSGDTGDYDHDTKRSTVQPKLIATQAEWRIAMLSEPFLSTDDLFEVSPLNQSSIKSALQQTSILNYQWRTQLDRINLVNRFIRLLCIDGTAVLRVGWETQEITEEVEEPLYQLNNPNPFRQQELQQELQNALQLKQAKPEMFAAQMDQGVQVMVYVYEQTGQLVEPHQIGTQKTQKTKMVRNTPMVEVCVPENFFVDPSCEGDIDKAQFVARTFATCRGWLEASSVDYQNLDDVAWESGEVRGSADYYDVTDPTYETTDETRHKCIATEYWGKWDINGDGTLVPIVATWIGDTLIRLEENPYPDGKPPFVFVSYTPEPYSVYGTPDAELTIPNQRIVGATLRGYVDMMAKSAAGQRGISKDALDDLNFDRFQRGEDYMINPGTNMAQAIYLHNFPTVNPSALNLIQQQIQDAEALSGVRPFQGGIDSPNATSVMQSGLGAIDAAAIREADIMKRISRGFVEIGKKIVAMNEVFLTPKDVVKITDSDFVPVNTDELSGSFDMRVGIQTQAQNSAKAKGLLFVLQTCGPNLEPGIRQMVMGEIARLTGLPALAESIENYQAQPDPGQQAEQQSKLMLTQAQAQKLQAAAEKSQADSAHKQAQTQQLQTNQKATDQQTAEILRGLLKDRKPDSVGPDISNAVSFMQAAQQEQARQQMMLQQQQQQMLMQQQAQQAQADQASDPGQQNPGQLIQGMPGQLMGPQNG